MLLWSVAASHTSTFTPSRAAASRWAFHLHSRYILDHIEALSWYWTSNPATFCPSRHSVAASWRPLPESVLRIWERSVQQQNSLSNSTLGNAGSFGLNVQRAQMEIQRFSSSTITHQHVYVTAHTIQIHHKNNVIYFKRINKASVSANFSKLSGNSRR